MKKGLFPRLALLGIRKNRAFFLPYLLSSAGMIMMYYLIHFLSRSPFVLGMDHGEDLGMFLSLGKFVIALFSLLFLFYTNSFLTKRRYKEFGLYNMLGMSKRHIGRIVFWESIYVTVAALGGGLIFGILFSKLAELGLLNLTHAGIGYGFTVSGEAVGVTLLLYGLIFVLLTVKSLITVKRTNPLELMKSEACGEKPPKANWALALLGVLMLSAAYYMSVTITNPLSALLLFFAAVLLVIAATYLLFISGSVALCRALQKNKRYYYQKSHFVSVSSMTFRMKRNGAGLASICILSTMVLVMVSTTASLYFGSESAMRGRYPRDIEVSMQFTALDDLSDDSIAQIRAAYTDAFSENGFAPQDVSEYRYSTISGMLKNNVIAPDPDYASALIDYSGVRVVYFLSLADYNAAMGTALTLKENEAYLFPVRCRYDESTLTVGSVTFVIAGTLEKCVELAEASSLMMPSFIVVVPDFGSISPLMEYRYESSGKPLMEVVYHFSYNTALNEEETIEIYHAHRSAAQAISRERGFSFSAGCLPEEKGDFYATFGGLFFLGIILSVVFIFAAAVIIYYKQIMEGYEDQKRFEIMQQVGMTRRDIRQAINSQILTVFFSPLLFAGLHLGFSFPFIWRILQMFFLRDLGAVLLVTAIVFAAFGLFYALIYKITAKRYFTIVSDMEA